MSINSRNGNTLLESGFFPPCRVATTAAIALSGLQTLDGVALADADRVLVKDQVDATTNGIYAAQSGNWVRTSDAAGNSQFFDGMAVVVARGNQNAGLTFVCTTTDDPVVVGTSEITFASQQDVINARQSATSTTSNSIGVGTRTFGITSGGENFQTGQWALIYETSNPANSMLAQITPDSGTITASVVAIGGSGTHSDWTIVLTNAPAAAGLQPPVGTGNVTGPGSATSGNLATFADTTGKVLADSGKAPGTLATLSATTFGVTGAASVGPAAMAGGAGLPPYAAAQPTDNLVLTNDGTNPNTDIQISVGRAPDDSGLYWLTLAGTMLKRIDTAWAAGGNVGNRKGMLLSGSSWLASKTYHLWLLSAVGLSVTSVSRTSNVATVTITGHPLGVGGTIRVYGTGIANVDTPGAVITAVATNTVSYASTGGDFGNTPGVAFADGFDIGATQQDAQGYPAATLPTGFGVKQCLGSIMTDGSKNVLGFVQMGDLFDWTASKSDVSFSNNSDLAYTLTVPQGPSVLARLSLLLRQTTGATFPAVRVSSTDSSDEAPGAGNADVAVGAASSAQTRAAGEKFVRTSTSGQIRVNLANGDANSIFLANTYGWRDPRRRMF